MYLSEAEEIFAYWDRSPPVYQVVSLIAQMLGWKPQKHREVEPVDMAALAAAGFGEAASVNDGLGAAILDFEELKRKYARAG